MSLSVCLNTKNEEKNIARALSSVADIADEIVIVDTGSSDRTTEIAGGFGAKIFHSEWCEDFAAADRKSVV